MNKFALLLLLLPTAGCSLVSDSVNEAMDTVETRLTERWAQEWSPALLTKVELELAGLEAGVIEKIDKNTNEKLDRLGINAKDFDTNKDGALQAGEALSLLKEMKAANDQQGQPFSLLEILLGFAGVYASGSMAKGGLRMLNKPKTQET